MSIISLSCVIVGWASVVWKELKNFGCYWRLEHLAWL